MVIAGANVVDQKLLEATIEAIVVERPDPEELEQNLCLDKGYDNPTGHDVTDGMATWPTSVRSVRIVARSAGQADESPAAGW